MPGFVSVSKWDLLIHKLCRFYTACIADNLSRHTGNRLRCRNLMKYNAAHRHPAALTDMDIARHFGAGADHHIIADFSMAVTALLARPAKCHAMQYWSGQPLITNGITDYSTYQRVNCQRYRHNAIQSRNSLRYRCHCCQSACKKQRQGKGRRRWPPNIA